MPGGRFSVHLETDSADEAGRVWQALSEGRGVHMPISEVFCAERFGMLTDRFGTPWMVSYTGAKWESM